MSPLRGDVKIHKLVAKVSESDNGYDKTPSFTLRYNLPLVVRW